MKSKPALTESLSQAVRPNDPLSGYHPERLLGFYRDMLRIRMVEEEIAERYAEQEMRCPVHLSIGQEASAVGACAALDVGDQIITTHRCHSHYLAKGGDLDAMVAEIYGKSTGCCGGRGGSMHLFDHAAGILASVPIVSSSVPLAVGAALTFRQRQESRVAVAFMGDGSLEEGVFHESANFAALKKLPVVFFVENNKFAVFTHIRDRQPDRPFSGLGDAYGMPTWHGDGNDILAVFVAMVEAAERARNGNGPSLLVADTYRWRAHCGPKYDHERGYRPLEEFEAWKARCPLRTFDWKLRERGVLSDTLDAAMRSEIEDEIRSAFEAAKAASFPDKGTLGEALYA